MIKKSKHSPDKILIHAVGNETRRDDGIALHALEFLRVRYPGLTTKSDYQLFLEDVLEWNEYDAVWFLDATYGKDLKTREANNVDLEFDPSVHHMGPDLLASMAKEIYQSNVEVYITEIPGNDFSLGEGLSEFAKSKLESFCSNLEPYSPIKFE